MLADDVRLGSADLLAAFPITPAERRRTAAEMHELGIGHEARPPAEGVEAPAQVDVLCVHEAGLAKPAHLLPRIGANCDHCAHCGLDVTRSPVIPVRAP